MADRCYLCGVSEETCHDEDFSNGYDFDKVPWVINSTMFTRPICHACWENYDYDNRKIYDAMEAVEHVFDCPPTIVSWIEDNYNNVENLLLEYVEFEDASKILKSLIKFAKRSIKNV